jgi:peptidoglycan/LPS O-acetylase OafA/YrhL
MRKESIPLTSIRGFAALWVATLHIQLNIANRGYNPWAGLSHFGYVGVDIFFILSGFILTAVYGGLAWRNVGAFFTRRVFRIYPMHLAVLGVMALLWLDIYLRFGVEDPSQELHWLPICALLLQPFLYHRLVWNAVTWSLSIEFVCYLFFPIVIMGLRRTPRLALLPLILIFAVLEHHVQVYGLYIWGIGAVVRGAAGFGLGMLLQLACQRLLPTPGTIVASLGEGLALGGIILCAALPPALGYGFYITLFAALLILCLSYDKGPVSWLLRRSVSHWLGRVSFSLYLVHETVFGVLWGHFPATRLPFGHDLNGFIWASGVLLFCLALSTLTWRLIEEPGRRLGGRIARRMERNIPKAVAPVQPEGGAPPEAASLPENAEAAILRV